MTISKSFAIVCLGLASAGLYGQTAARHSRLKSVISRTSVVPLPNHVHLRARPEFDRGAAAPSMPLGRMRLQFKTTPTQQAALEALLKDQQNPNSPHYHQWLTPEDFG